MRIIGGSAAGTILKVPSGLGVRPTPDRVRQAIFNSLGARVEGARVLELFGGTGALSLECLSRGAESAHCVEKSGKHAAFIRGNVRAAKLKESAFHLRTQDVFTAMSQLLESGFRFDLVLADPPFGEKNLDRRSESFAQKVLDDPKLPQLLDESGLLILGHAKRDSIEIPAVWTERKCLKHGDSVFRILERSVGQ